MPQQFSAGFFGKALSHELSAPSHYLCIAHAFMKFEIPALNGTKSPKSNEML